MLGPIEADPLGAELPGALRVPRVVRVRPDLEPSLRVRPLEERLQVRLLAKIRIQRGDVAFVHLAAPAIDRDEVASVDHLDADPELARVVVNDDRLASGHARDAEPAGDDGRMAGRPAAGRQHALGIEDPVDVVWGCLDAHEDDGLLLATHRLRLVRIEDGVAGRGARRGVQAPREITALAPRDELRFVVELRQQ